MNPLRESSGGKLLENLYKKCDSRRKQQRKAHQGMCVFCVTAELGFHSNTSNMPPQKKKHPDGREDAHNTYSAVNYVPSPNNTECTAGHTRRQQRR